MARKKQSSGQLVITEHDEVEAAEHNRRVLTERIKNARDKSFDSFIAANMGLLGDLLMPESPHLLRDYINNPTRKELRDIVADAIGQADTAHILKFKTDKLVHKKRLETPESVAFRHQHTAERRAAFNQLGREHMTAAGRNFIKGIAGVGTILTGAASLRGAPFLALSSAARLTVLPLAHTGASVLAFAKVSKGRALLAGVGTAAIIGTAATTEFMDSTPYLAMMSTPEMRQDICNIEPGALTSTANAVYATTDSLFTGKTGNLTRSVMLHGSEHGVPAIALHYISYLETNKFRDVVANNSSADGLFQITDETKFAYLKAYGKKTFAYSEAKDRIENGVSSQQDSLLIEAIDTVSRTDMDDLRTALKDQKMDSVLHAALKSASDPYMQAELVALDMVKNAPGLTEDGISNEQILTLAEAYYAEHHFLGMTTYRKLEKLAQEKPDEKIGETLPNTVKANPGLLNGDMTAADALNGIKKTFADYVEKPYQVFTSAYDVNVTAGQICLTDAAKGFLPEKISPAKVALMESGLYPEYIRATEIWAHLAGKAADLKQDYADNGIDVSFTEAIEQAVQEATSPYAPDHSPRPLPRPEHIKTLTASNPPKDAIRPMPRPPELNNNG